MAITWRQLAAPDLMPAAALFEGANQGFKDALSGLRSAKESYERTGIENVEKMRAYNTGLYQDKLASYQTPEELAAAQAKGDLKGLLNSFGGVVDRDAIRGAEANALKTLQERWRTNNAFTADRDSEAQRPLVDTIRMKLASDNPKDQAEARAMFEANPQLRNRAELAQELYGAQQRAEDEGRSDQTYADSRSERSRLEQQWKREDRVREIEQEVDTAIPVFLESGTSERQALDTFTQTAKERNYSATEIAMGQSRIRDAFSANNAPTADEARNQELIAGKYLLELEDTVRNHPYEMPVRTPADQALTVDAAKDLLVRTMTPDDKNDSRAGLDHALETAIKAAGYKSERDLPDGVRLGALLKEAALGVGVSEYDYWFDDADFSGNEDELAARLTALLEKEISTLNNQGIVQRKKQQTLEQLPPGYRQKFSQQLMEQRGK